jgi:tetratricopeptide (TPR) repeat protein
MVLVPAALLLCLELALRIAGFGQSTRFFIQSRLHDQEVVTENPRFTWLFFPRGMARHPEPVQFTARKAPGAYRIFVLGESAAQGDPDIAFSFSRQLEVLLRARYPALRFEVLNVAITAINSHVIRRIAAECAHQQGDLWIVYMGNNEVVGPYGAGTVFGMQAPNLAFIRAAIFLKSTRLGQWFQKLPGILGLNKSDQEEWGGMAMFARHKIRQDDPRMAKVYRHFEENLRDIVRSGTDSGAQVAVCSVASNLRDCAPFASLHRVDLTPDQLAQWNQHYDAGVQLEQTSQVREAVERFQKAAEIDPQFADLQFRLARSRLALDQPAEARKHFVLARDLDALRFRADSRINDILEKNATNRAGAHFLPIETRIHQLSPHHITGEEFLYEHVHLNFDGNYQVAKELANLVSSLLPAQAASSAKPEWLARDACAQQLAFTPWNQSHDLEEIGIRLRDIPFTLQLDHTNRLARWEKQLAELRPKTKPYALKLAAQTYRQALATAPDDWLLHANYSQLLDALNDPAGAADQLREVNRLVPHYARAYYQLGLELLKLQRADEARRQFEETLRLDPYHAEARKKLSK